MVPLALPPQEITLELPELRLAAKVWGSPDGLPVLALHGWLDNAASYDRLAPLLPELRIVAPDLPGHGRSDWRPPGNAYHFVDWLPDLFAIADALAWERFAVIGHSMGAGIGALAAGTFPERITRLVLIEGLGPVVSPAADAPKRTADYVTARRRVRRREPLPHPSRAAATETLAKVVPNLSVESAALLVERGTREVPGGVTWSTDPRLRQVSPMRYTEEHVRAFLAQITAPTLLLWATEGWPFAAEAMQARIACIPDLQVERLVGGHHLHVESTERVLPPLRRFFGLP